MDIDPYSSIETNKRVSKENSNTALTLIQILQNDYDILHAKYTMRNPSSSNTTDITVKLTYVSSNNCDIEHTITTSDDPSSTSKSKESDRLNKSKRYRFFINLIC